MGILTLAEFRTDIDGAIGTRSHGNPLYDQWTNSAYYEISAGIKHPELQAAFSVSTVSGTISYTGPIDTIGWEVVYDETNDKVLERIDLFDFFRRDRSVIGVPDKWARNADNLILDPTPNAVIALNILHTKEPTALSSPTDKTILPAHWDYPIYLLAVERAHLHAAEENRAAHWRGLAVINIRSKILEDSMISGRFDITTPQGA